MSYSFALIVGYFESAFLTLHPHEVALWAATYFFSIYLFFACAFWLLAHLVNRPIETRETNPNQMALEIFESLRTVLIFGLSMVIPWTMLKFNVSAFAGTISIVSILAEMIVLIIWNDIHFYSVHRLLHSQFIRSHAVHHSSVTATPFTAYSMSIWEAVLLSSVTPIAMLFHHFSFVSLAFLSIWSIAINTLVHSNCNLFPNAKAHSLLGLIKRHQRHHSTKNGNYSFFFGQLDYWFKTIQ